MKYGPDRKELWFRFLFSLAGLALMVFAIAYRGIGGMAWIEVLGLASVFFGGSAIWSGRKLFRRQDPE